MGIRQRKVVALIEFQESQNVQDFEQKIRRMIARGELPKIRYLCLCIDHKNLAYMHQKERFFNVLEPTAPPNR